MLCGVPYVAKNFEGPLVEAVETSEAIENEPLEEKFSLLELFWPMPIGLLAMGTLVSAFLGLCLALR